MKHLLIAAALIEEATLGTRGEDIFIGTLPHDVAKGVMLKDPLYGAEIDEAMRGFFQHSFMVIVRDPDPMVGYARARAISDALKVNRRTFDDIYILQMNATQLPVTYPKGQADDVETSVRIQVSFGELP